MHCISASDTHTTAMIFPILKLTHRIEVRSAATDSVIVVTMSDVRVNQGLSMDDFTADALPGADIR